ncbi:hypothetical protein SAMN02799624_01656 [Paenibacillus sp. UNC496MF]|uniref:hypothetical protein n=1 Tax=Paenibacillus sp. UNC496MF TaxID=1502753 RepID=UPI0008E88D7A|nr:hypothetical protein [Paenibacillus sp. UNC496MF]SFI61671.1 hypothetical protein SAMN02799624_01656 [Paenibacillus sp. UNC496MF]
MEKKVTTSPVVKPSSKGATIAPVGKASKGATGKKSTGTIPTPPGKASTAPIETPKPSTHHVHKHEMKHWCHEHMHRYVLAHTHDGWCCDGFIEHIDDEVVCLAVPHCGGMDRAFVPGPFFPPLYPYPFFPRRRFYRQVFPLAALVGLSLLPFY